MPDELADFLKNNNPFASQRAAIEKGAKELGIDPRDYATAISYESAGTFDPWVKGPVTKWGQHRGTIQYGAPQRRKYGVHKGQSFEDQVTRSNVQYLRDAGVKPGMTFAQIYAAINGGNVNKNLNTPDANTGRTIADNISRAEKEHRANVLKRFGWDDGELTPSQPQQDELMTFLSQGTPSPDQQAPFGSDTEIQAWNERFPDAAVKPRLGQLAQQAAGELMGMSEVGIPTADSPPVAPPNESDFQEWRAFKNLEDTPESRLQFEADLKANAGFGSDAMATQTELSIPQGASNVPISVPNTSNNVPIDDLPQRAPTRFKAGDKPLTDDELFKTNISYPVDLTGVRGNKTNYAVEQVRQALIRDYGMTPEQSRVAVGGLQGEDLPADYNGIVDLHIPRGHLAAAIGADKVKADYDKERADPTLALYEQARDAQPNVGLQPVPEIDQATANVMATPFGGSTEADIQNERARLQRESLTPEERAEAVGVGENISDDFTATLQSGLIGAGGRTLSALAGVIRAGDTLGVIPESWRVALSKEGQKYQLASETESKKNTGMVNSALRITTGLAGDLPRFLLLSRLPGGMAVVFGADAGLQSAGRGETVEQGVIETSKGAVIGAVFSGASKVARAVENGTLRTFVNPVFDVGKTATPKERLAAKVFGEGARIGTIITGTSTAQRFQGATPGESLEHGIVMALTDLAMRGGTSVKARDVKALAGKVFRARKGDEVVDVTVEPQGTVKLLKGEVPEEMVDVEMVFDPVEQVYKAATEKATVAPKRIGQGEVSDTALTKYEPKTEVSEPTAPIQPNEVLPPTKAPVAEVSKELQITKQADVDSVDELSQFLEKGDIPTQESPSIQESKEPWEMTQDEFTIEARKPLAERTVQDEPNVQALIRAHEIRLGESALQEGKVKAGQVLPYMDSFKSDKHNAVQASSHYAHVLEALESGKSVPPEVLADYPDLAKRFNLEPKSVPEVPESGEKQTAPSVGEAEPALTPSTTSEARRAMAEGEPVENIAKRYNLEPEQIAQLEPLGEVGQFGKTSSVMYGTLLKPQNLPLFNEMSRIFTQGDTSIADMFTEDRKGAVTALLDTIAQSVGKSRSSQMNPNDWTQVLLSKADQMPVEGVEMVVDAIKQQTEWHRNLVSAVSDPDFEQIVNDVIVTFGVTEYADLEKKGLGRQLRQGITKIGDKYGISRDAIKEAYNQTVLGRLSKESGEGVDTAGSEEVAGEVEEAQQPEETGTKGLGSSTLFDITRKIHSYDSYLQGQKQGIIGASHSGKPTDAERSFPNVVNEFIYKGNTATELMEQDGFTYSVGKGKKKRPVTTLDDFQEANPKYKNITQEGWQKLFEPYSVEAGKRIDALWTNPPKEVVDAYNTIRGGRDTESEVPQAQPESQEVGSTGDTDWNALFSRYSMRKSPPDEREIRTVTALRNALPEKDFNVVTPRNSDLDLYVTQVKYLGGGRYSSGGNVSESPEQLAVFMQMNAMAPTTDTTGTKTFSRTDPTQAQKDWDATYYTDELAAQQPKAYGGLTAEDIAAIDRNFERRRREWIDKERETNPTFAPDIESAKELLSPEELKEVEEYESLRYKAVALDSGYKPFKMTAKDKKRGAELAKKYHHIYYSPKTEPVPESETAQKTGQRDFKDSDTVTNGTYTGHIVQLGKIQRVNYRNEQGKLISKPVTDEWRPVDDMSFEDIDSTLLSPKEESAKEIKRYIGLPLESLARTAKFSIADDGMILAENPQAAAFAHGVVQAASGRDTKVFGGFHGRGKTASGMPAIAKRYGIDFPLDPQYNDITLAINFGDAAKFTQQEERSHRADFRSRNFADLPIEPYEEVDVYNKAATGLEPRYGDDKRKLHNEITAKMTRDDAAQELGLTEPELAELRDFHGEQLLKNGVKTETIAKNYADVSETATRFINEQRTRDAGRVDAGSESAGEAEISTQTSNAPEVRTGRDGDSRPFAERDAERDAGSDEAARLFEPGRSGDELARIEQLPIAGETVDGLKVREHIPNQDSIESTFTAYKILPKVRAVPMSEFSGEFERTQRTIDLAEQIQESGEINPLIVAYDSEGAYILEGGHRYDALGILGKQEIPAQVVIDTFDPNEDSIVFSIPKDAEFETLEKDAETNLKTVMDHIYDGKRDVSLVEATVNLVRTGYLAGLSVVKTNLQSNTLNVIVEQIAKPWMASVDILNAKFNPKAKGMRTTPGLSLGDVAEGLFGKTGTIRAGTVKGEGSFVHALTHGVPKHEASKFDIASTPEGGMTRNFGVPALDALMEGVKRLSIGIDRPYKAFARTAEMRGLSRVVGKNLVKQGVETDWRDAMKSVQKDPSQMMFDLAEHYAETLTFQNPNPVTDVMDKFKAVLLNDKMIAKFIPSAAQHRMAKHLGSGAYLAIGVTVPFMRTPVNVGIRSLEYTPLGALSAAWKFYRIGSGYERTHWQAETENARQRFAAKQKSERFEEDKAFRKETRTRLDKYRIQKQEKLNEVSDAAERIEADNLTKSQKTRKFEILREQKNEWLTKWQSAKEGYEAKRQKEFESVENRRKASDMKRVNELAAEDVVADIKFTALENKMFAEAAGRSGFGMTVGGLLLLGIVKGLIEAVGTTDYDEEKGKYFAKRAAGIPDNSVKIGNRRYPIDRFPFGNAMVMGINLLEQYERPGSSSARAFAMTDRLRKDLQRSNPITTDEFGRDDFWSWFGAHASSVTPIVNMKILQEVADVTDPRARKYFNEGFFAQYQSRIPGLRQTLEPSTSTLGERGDFPSRLGRLVDPMRSVQEVRPQSTLVPTPLKSDTPKTAVPTRRRRRR